VVLLWITHNPTMLIRQEKGKSILIVKRAGLEHVRFHDLRHTFASLALLRGAKPKVISEALGHSSVAFTMDVYSHIIEGMQSEMMALLDEVLPSGMGRKSEKVEGVRNEGNI